MGAGVFVPDVFISYSADAKKWAAKLSDRLQTEGLSTWSDFRSLVPGLPLSQQLEQALDNTKCYVFVVGPRNVVREWQDLEWQAALKRTWSDPEKRVIPVLIGHADAPPFLRNWVSLRIRPDADESGLAKKITDIVRGTSPPEKPASVRAPG